MSAEQNNPKVTRYKLNSAQFSLTRAERIRRSARFRHGRAICHMQKNKVHKGLSFWQMLWSYLGGRYRLKPGTPLPYQALNMQKLAIPSQSLRVTWLGHACLLIELGGRRILTDPVFGYAAPSLVKPLFVHNMFARNVPIPVSREKLPQPDIILISHDHYDHLESASVKYYASQAVQFVVPLGVGVYLEKWGVAQDNIIELDWWQSVCIAGVELVCTPANHHSGRSLWNGKRTLWASWVVRNSQQSLYFSGDSAYDRHFKEIGEHFGPFDLTCLEIAADLTARKGYPVENWGHMQARHAVKAHQDLQGKVMLPIHWATYELFSHRWDEPILDLLKNALLHEFTVTTPMVGETFSLHDPLPARLWWMKGDYALHHLRSLLHAL